MGWDSVFSSKTKSHPDVYMCVWERANDKMRVSWIPWLHLVIRDLPTQSEFHARASSPITEVHHHDHALYDWRRDCGVSRRARVTVNEETAYLAVYKTRITPSPDSLESYLHIHGVSYESRSSLLYTRGTHCSVSYHLDQVLASLPRKHRDRPVHCQF